MTFILRFWPYILASVVVLGIGVWVNRLGYESGYNASEAKWQKQLAISNKALADANERTRLQEEASRAITQKAEAEYAQTLASLNTRAADADKRIRALSVRVAASNTSRCELPKTPDSQPRDAGPTEVERRADAAGSSISAVGRDCEDDAARLEFWTRWYQAQAAALLTSSDRSEHPTP